MTKITHMMKKMMVLGDGAVGKTSLIRRFVLDSFDDDYIVTIGTKTTAKSLKINMQKEVIDLKLQIWDILGQKGYAKLHHTSFRGTNGVFMVADITRKETLCSLDNYWIPKLQLLVGNIPFIILANKSDLHNKAKLSREELREFASKHSAPFYLTSARNGENVDRAFYELGKRMFEVKDDMSPKPTKFKIMHPRIVAGDGKGKITRLIDRIIDDFCNENGDFDDAMPILRRQFEIAELDLNTPSIEALEIAIERLAKVERGYKKKVIVDENRARRLNWLEKINT